MARQKPRSPEVQAHQTYLEGVAKNLRDKVYGPDGMPWGTTFEELEELAVQLGQEISRQLLQQALQKQSADTVPNHDELCPTCQQPSVPNDPEPRFVVTRVGDAEWDEPQRYCRHCRRSFFPSVQKFGD